MAYYLSEERHADVRGAWLRYQEYLRENQHQFPTGAFALGTAPWWHDFNNHQSPHDAWLENLTISEAVNGEDIGQRDSAIRVRLLGAYHDGFIELFYPRVFSYSLERQASRYKTCDWCYDEFRLSPDGHVIHEIEWHGGSRWLIEASDVEYQWVPI